jgi:hypothetical protein
MAMFITPKTLKEIRKPMYQPSEVRLVRTIALILSVTEA